MTQMQADRQNPVVGWLFACFVTFGGLFLVQQCTGTAHGDELRKRQGCEVAWVDIRGGPDPVIALVPVVPDPVYEPRPLMPIDVLGIGACLFLSVAIVSGLRRRI